MIKKTLILASFLPLVSFGAINQEALKAKEEALRALSQFNPSSVLGGYTNNPRETNHLPSEGLDDLKAKGLAELKSNQRANELYQEAENRDKDKKPKGPEMDYAEGLLQNPESVLEDAMGCAKGQCDNTQMEVSSDLGEGLSHLGALSGVAQAVSDNQINQGTAAIFAGSSMECKKYPLGFRDCCKDSGWGDWIKNCPKELQDLQRAKQDNRVVYLGNYKRSKFGSRHYVYCIFPSKLAGIVQIQGRGGQLQIPFGWAKAPDCRGLRPEELERINFGALDLSAIEQDFVAKKTLPDGALMQLTNQAHIERLNQQGRAHD